MWNNHSEQQNSVAHTERHSNSLPQINHLHLHSWQSWCSLSLQHVHRFSQQLVACGPGSRGFGKISPLNSKPFITHSTQLWMSSLSMMELPPFVPGAHDGLSWQACPLSAWKSGAEYSRNIRAVSGRPQQRGNQNTPSPLYRNNEIAANIQYHLNKIIYAIYL